MISLEQVNADFKSLILLSLRLEGEETLKSRCVCIGLRAEKFNIANNDDGRRHKCDFSASDRK